MSFVYASTNILKDVTIITYGGSVVSTLGLPLIGIGDYNAVFEPMDKYVGRHWNQTVYNMEFNSWFHDFA